MNWNRLDFSKHYKKLIVEGNDLEILLNICVAKRIHVNNVKLISDTKMMIYISERYYYAFADAAGSRYRIKVVDEGGYVLRAKELFKRKSLVAGIVVFIAILFYQSLFISEIEVMGYESITEQALRESMREAGFYEGCRKNTSIDKVKMHLYEDFDNISWIGIKYKGNLAQVTIAETDFSYDEQSVEDDKPCNIVAETDGYISSVDPEQGIAAVEKGKHVREGDVLISGKIPLEKTTYEEGADVDDDKIYVHASGTVYAKVPVRLNFYDTAYKKIKKATGKRMITLSFNDNELLRSLCPYESSQVKKVNVINWIKPVKLKIQMNIIEEVRVQERRKTQDEVKKLMLNEIHGFAEEKLQDNEQILNKSLNFTREKNIIRVGVTLETLQQIGKEEEIIVDKSNRKSDQNDNQ